jgi:hypothetical protein
LGDAIEMFHRLLLINPHSNRMTSSVCFRNDLSTLTGAHLRLM